MSTACRTSCRVRCMFCSADCPTHRQRYRQPLISSINSKLRPTIEPCSLAGTCTCTSKVCLLMKANWNEAGADCHTSSQWWPLSATGIYHSSTPLFREKDLHELAKTKSTVRVLGEADSAYRLCIVHASNTVAMSVITTAAVGRTSNSESVLSDHQRLHSQGNGVTRIRPIFCPTPSGNSRPPTRTISLPSKPFDIGD